MGFNHAIGLPQNKNKPFPLFDYKQLIFDTLHTHKHVWINKATGLGITEFMLRYMAWLCLKDNGHSEVHNPKSTMELIKKFEHNCLSEKIDDRRMDRRSIAEVTEIWTDEVFLDDEV